VPGAPDIDIPAHLDYYLIWIFSESPMVKNKTGLASMAVFFAAAGGLAVFLTLGRQLPSFTIFHYGLKLFGQHILPFLGLWAALFAGLAMAVTALARTESAAFARPEPERILNGALAISPLILLSASPLLAADYLTREDFRGRFWLLGIFVLAAVVYLKIADRVALGAGHSAPARSVWKRFVRLSTRRRLWILGIAAFVLYAACTFVLVSEGITFSGDEPNYLLSAHSLFADRDINLANNYAQKDHFHFYSEKADPRLKMAIYAREGKKGRGYIYPINLPGISALMVPFYALGQVFGDSLWRTAILKGSLIIWAVLLGLQLYLLARDLWKREGLALGLWALYAFSAPVLFYAVHLYPEIPIALFSIYIYRMLRSGRALRSAHLVFLGALLGTFFWFGLKYNLIFWPLLAVGVFDLWKSEAGRARIPWFVIPALLGMAVFYFGVWTMYGTFSPFAVYEGVITGAQARAVTQSFLDLPHAARIETFLDYFLDQRDGLFLYAPFWFFALLGIVEMAKRARRELFCLLLIAGPFVLNYAFFTHRQGSCPPGRVLAPISWIGAVAVGYFLAYGTNRVFRWFFGLASVGSYALSGILIAHPQFLYQPTTHEYSQRAGDLFAYLSSTKVFLPPLLPSFIKVDNSGYITNYVWVGLVALFVGAYLLLRKKSAGPPAKNFHFFAAAILLGGSFFLWVLHPRAAFYPSRPMRYSTGKSLGFYLNSAGSGLIAHDEGRLYLHFAKFYRIFFASRTPLERMEIVFGSEKGEHAATMSFFDTPLTVERTTREIRKFVFKPSGFYRRGNLYVYEMGVTLEHLSDENMLSAPYLLQIIPLR
jgi:hypothetical protein